VAGSARFKAAIVKVSGTATAVSRKGLTFCDFT
jgi:hypothetical protein